MGRAAKERLVRSFARAMASLSEYIPGPDMGTDEACMGWIHDEIGRAVGLPAVLGGIPLDAIGATGLGLAASAQAVQEAGYLRLGGARVAVQGFGAVGGHAARFLADRGAVVVAASDSAGAVVNPEGLDVAGLAACKAEGGSVASFPGGSPIPRDDLLGVDCDLLAPAARPDVLTVGNAELVRASVILEGPTSRPPGRPSSCCTSAGCWWCPTSSPTPAGSSARPSSTRAAPSPRPWRWSRRRSAPTPPRCCARPESLARIAEATGYRRRW
jgi:glutamate dehydrogenase/leucine dehydrogenase